jgi:hypothetical protein
MDQVGMTPQIVTVEMITTDIWLFVAACLKVAFARVREALL